MEYVINKNILRLCREQVALSIDDAQKKAKISTLSDIESGKRKPTFKQLDKLSDLYLVPAWVFMKDKLPDEYNFNKVPSFRKFKNSKENDFGYELRRLVTKIEGFRKVIIELREELDDPISPLKLPKGNLTQTSIITFSQKVKHWLNQKDNRNLDFNKWRDRLEQVGIFVFVTGSFPGWSKIDPKIFRGLSIYHNILPIIVINGSDSYKAKSFTLFHELGHIFKKSTMFDRSVGDQELREERLCDNFAGEFLMPEDQVSDSLKNIKELKFENIKEISKNLKVSKYALLVRLKKLDYLKNQKYKKFLGLLKKEHKEFQEKIRKEKKTIGRNIPVEAKSQYGSIYSRTVIQAYFNREISLHKARNLFGFKKAEYVLDLKKRVS